METVIANYFEAKHQACKVHCKKLKSFITTFYWIYLIMKHIPYLETIDKLFQEIVLFFEHNKSPNYNFVYDQVIGFGELISTTIISHYLNEIGITNTWLDVRTLYKNG